jgi:hypothetical protein
LYGNGRVLDTGKGGRFLHCERALVGNATVWFKEIMLVKKSAGGEQDRGS